MHAPIEKIHHYLHKWSSVFIVKNINPNSFNHHCYFSQGPLNMHILVLACFPPSGAASGVEGTENIGTEEGAAISSCSFTPLLMNPIQLIDMNPQCFCDPHIKPRNSGDSRCRGRQPTTLWFFLSLIVVFCCSAWAKTLPENVCAVAFPHERANIGNI